MTGKRILIAEDSTGLRTLLKKTLADLGHERIIEAENGKVALEKFKATWTFDKSISIVITDIQMPEANGLEVIQGIRSIAAKEELPILVLSVESDRETIVDAIQFGANDYMIKPVQKDSLKAKLDKWMKKD